jgi:hypothetical protein
MNRRLFVLSVCTSLVGLLAAAAPAMAGASLQLHCPVHKRIEYVAPGARYSQCDACGTNYCSSIIGPCKLSGCMGWLRERFFNG